MHQTQSGSAMWEKTLFGTESHSVSRSQTQWWGIDLQRRGGRAGPQSSLPQAALLQPFLCSVPGDLQLEWDYLRTQAFPYLDSLCQARGTCLRPVDTQRWDGEDAENDRPLGPTHAHPPLSTQRLKISLDLITRSPFFLCVLGHRYGLSRPDGSAPVPASGPAGGQEGLPEAEMSLCVAGRGGHPWVLQGRHQTCSLTELEITQAAFRGESRRCFFYFKDYSLQDEDEEEEEEEEEGRREGQRALFLSALSSQTRYERQRLRELKARIIDRCLPVRFFRNLQDLGKLVRRDWEAVIEQLYGPVEQQPACSGHQDSIERWHHEISIQALCRWFVPSAQATAVLETIHTFVLSVIHDGKASSPAPTSRTSGIKFTSNHDDRESEKSILLLCGERGCGKSSLAACWLQEFRRKSPRIPAVPHFCGISSSCADAGSLLRRCTSELRRAHYGSLPEWSEGLEERVEPRPLHLVVQAFSAAAALGPCVLVLDGLDLLTGTLGLSMQEVKELRWLPAALPPRCKLVVTTTSADLTYKSLTSRPDVQLLSWPGLCEPWVRRCALLRHLALPCREPPAALLQSVMGKERLGRLPITLAILGSELRTCGVLREEEEEEELLEEYVEVDSVPKLWVRVIQRWVRDYSRASEGPPNRPPGAGPTAQVSTTELRGWVWDALCLIHLSRTGLADQHVRSLLEELGHRVWPLEWAWFRSAAGPWVQEKPGGQLGFSHQTLSQAMELLLPGMGLGKGPEGQRRTRRAFHRTLAQFFQRPSKELRGWVRHLEELPWHLEQLEAWGELHAVLTDPETVEFLISSLTQRPQLRVDVVRHWTLLIQRGYDPAVSYQNLLRQGPPSSPRQTRRARGHVARTDPAVLPSDVSPEEHSEGTFIPKTQREGTVEVKPLWEPADRGRVAAFFAEVLLCLGRTPEAEDMLLQAEATLTQADEGDRDSVRILLKVQQTLAELYMQTRRLQEAGTYCNRGLETAQTLSTISSEETEDVKLTKGQLLCSLCQMLFVNGRLHEAPGLFTEIRAVNHSASHPCAEATVTLLQGIHKLSLGDLGAAENCFQAALSTRRCWYGCDNVFVAEVEEHLAGVWAQTCADTGWSQRQAIELYRHVIHVKDQDAKLHPLASSLSHPMGYNLALTLIKLGRLLLWSSSMAERREGRRLLQRAGDLSTRLLGPEHPLTRHTHQILNTESRRLAVAPAPRSRPASCGMPLMGRPGTKSDGDVVERTFPHPPKKRSTTRRRHSAPAEPDARRESAQTWDGTFARPWAALQTTVFGPRSDVGNLVPRPQASPGPSDGARLLHRTARCGLPASLLLQEHTVNALNRQIGTPLYRKSQRTGAQLCRSRLPFTTGGRSVQSHGGD